MGTIKIVVLGDRQAGKTCLLVSFTNNTFPKEYEPTEFDQYHTKLMVEHKLIQLDLNDTSGKHDVKMRKLSFTQTDIFMIVFSISFESVTAKWLKEIEVTMDREENQVPFILIGCKSDERATTAEDTIVSQSDIDDFVRRNPWCLNYRETSALTQQGIQEAFLCAVKRVLHPPNEQIP